MYNSCIIEDSEGLENINLLGSLESNCKLDSVEFLVNKNDTEICIDLKEKSKKSMILSLNCDEETKGKVSVSTLNNGILSEVYSISFLANRDEQKSINFDLLNIKQIKISIDSVPLDKIHFNLRSIDYNYPKLESLDIIKQKDDYIEGNIEIEQDGILYVPFIFDDNWRAIINGKEQKVIKVNVSFCGVELMEGKNNIVFFYDYKETRIGLIVSLFSLGILIIAVTADKCKRKIFRNYREDGKNDSL